MSFRKRNIGLTGPSSLSTSTAQLSPTPTPGVRPSPLDGRPTTSAGTPPLDDLLAGHAGLALGNSLLIEENGTTDFAGVLLRYYAAEGVVQGHRVLVVGVGRGGGRELPGLVGTGERMRMRRKELTITAPLTPNRGPISRVKAQTEQTTPAAFIHNFDLTKRLTVSPGSIAYIPVSHSPISNPFSTIIPSLTQSLNCTPTNHNPPPHNPYSPSLQPSTHPTLAPPPISSPSCTPLRSLLRSHPARLSAMLTLPLSLHPRSTGLVRWIEHICDGVLELTPFPHRVEVEPPSGKAGKGESENPQGMVKVHKLPVLTEKGGGGGGGGMIWHFR
ncbi:hypothetical protein ABVK25_001059 [Lepraria finkii]|uniref:Elongator complex protein 4 n=1 Tax=Lepraria finkii TaxID=1340010 RepID=A0ABR4BKJ6_9LECA